MPNEERRPPEDEEPPLEESGGEPTEGNVAPEPAQVQPPADPARPLTADFNAAKLFLHSIFRTAPGFIEVRLIEDKKPGAVIKRAWYATVEDLIADLPALRKLADERKAAVFFGVLWRRERGKGKAADVIPGWVAWADLDYKDFPGGEAEARKRLAEFPLPPSIVVRSAHGLHAYWLVRKPTPPEELSAISRGLAHALGGDHAFDAARILRMPGTNNWKDPEHPILVEIESIEAEREYNPDELTDALQMLNVSVAAPAAAPTSAGGEIAGPLHPKLLALIQRVQRLKCLYEGRGKPELDDDGSPLDTTSSGYDYSLVLALPSRGILDPHLLGNALWNRPDQAAQAKGLDYINRTVERALERFEALAEEDEEDDVQIDFVVEKVRVFGSVPPVYEFQIDGKTFTLKTPELLSPDSFTVAFVNTHRRVPTLPKKGWASQVNVWLAEAELVEQPPEASEEPAFREAVSRIIEDMPAGEESKDLDHGKALMLEDGGKAFKVDAVLKLALEDWKCARRNDVSRVLKHLGYESGTRKVGTDGKVVRVWSRRTSA